jgi:DNA-binding GntR family transcriptional regulator
MIAALTATTLRNQIVDTLREAILSGEIRPGARLSERLIAEELGVSRPPLREAIRQLESEGLLVSVARRGSFVRTFSGEEVREIYATRYALEAAAAEFVAESGTDECINELQLRLVDMEKRTSEGVERTIDADILFHRALVTGAGVKRLSETWELLVSELRLALCLVDASYFEFDFIEETHRTLLDAISAKDMVAIRTHLQQLLAVGDALGTRWDELRNQDSTTHLKGDGNGNSRDASRGPDSPGHG